MKANAVLQKFFKQHGTKKLAGTLGLSEPFLYKWCQPDGGKASGGWNPLERVAALTAATGDVALVEYLCEEAGGRFVPQAEMPSRLRQWWTELKMEMEKLLKAAREKPAAAKTFGPAEGFRCRHRRPGGRCGYQAARRN